MPIRINLLAEAQAAEEMRRRDPVKRAIIAAVSLVVLVILWIGVLQLRISSARSDLAASEAKWNEMQAGYEAIIAQQKLIGETDRKLAALNRYSTNRFLWGNVMDAFQQTVVDNVQLVRFRGEQAFQLIESAAARKAAAGGAPAPKPAAGAPPAKPSVAVERITLLIEARDHEPARKNYNAYLAGLLEHPFFQANLPRSDAIRLMSLGQPTQNPATPGRDFMPFTLECVFPEMRRNE